jgi:hypothetical protein
MTDKDSQRTKVIFHTTAGQRRAIDAAAARLNKTQSDFIRSLVAAATGVDAEIAPYPRQRRKSGPPTRAREAN